MDGSTPWIGEVERAARGLHLQARDRDDLTQETLLRVWQRVAARGEAAAPRGWIRTVLRRIHIDRWRKRRQAPASLDADVMARGLSPLDDAAWNELRGLVRSAIQELPGPQRDVVESVFYENKTFKEIAAVQGVPLNTALGRMHLAMKKLRAVLEQHGDPSR